MSIKHSTLGAPGSETKQDISARLNLTFRNIVVTEMGSPKAKSYSVLISRCLLNLGSYFICQLIFALVVQRWLGEWHVEVTRWMSENSPAFIEVFHHVSDPLLTDIAAPIVRQFLFSGLDILGKVLCDTSGFAGAALL